MQSKIMLIIACINVIFLISACSNYEPTQVNELDNSYLEQVELSDPSLEKCISDGYRLVPIQELGVVHSYLCVNEAAHKKCDSWAYYRKECSLAEIVYIEEKSEPDKIK